MTKRISLGGPALVALMSVVLSGCADSRPPVSPEDTEKMTQYAKCMQQYGIDIPVPGEAEPPGGLFTINTSDPNALAARSACARLEPAAHRQGQLDPAQEERVLKLAQCLRAEGIKAEDPAAGELNVTLEEGATYTQQQLVDAYTTCNQQVPAVP